MFKTNQTSKGIGLLELMLSLAIIAVLLVMATRYYGIAHRSQRTNAAISQVNAIQGALANWKAGKADYSSLPSPALPTLASMGTVAPDAAAGKNVWGGKLSVKTSQGGRDAVIVLSGIPQYGCMNLAEKFKDNNGSCITIGDKGKNSSTFQLTVK